MIRLRPGSESGLWRSNTAQSPPDLARSAGCPKDKYAGIVLAKKIGDKVSKGEHVMAIFSEKRRKLNAAARLAAGGRIFYMLRKKMLIEKVA